MPYIDQKKISKDMKYKWKYVSPSGQRFGYGNTKKQAYEDAYGKNKK